MGEYFVGCSHSAGKAKNQNRRGQGGREAHLPQPICRIERQPLPESALLGRFERFLQAHARSRQQVRRRLSRAIQGEQLVKLLLRLEFSGAVGTALHVLLQFMTSIVGQFAINMKSNIFSYPFAFHSNLVSTRFQSFQGFKTFEALKPCNLPTSYPPTARATFA